MHVSVSETVFNISDVTFKSTPLRNNILEGK
jgi:hypothetical protein